MARATAVAMATLALAVAGCSIIGPEPSVEQEPVELVPPEADATIDRTFVSVDTPDADAYTYNDIVPEGTRLALAFDEISAERTELSAFVAGLHPNSDYTADLHTGPCPTEIPNPEQEGEAESHDPLVDNPIYSHNGSQVAFHFFTDSEGHAHSVNRVDWILVPEDVGSFVMHDPNPESALGREAGLGEIWACANIGGG